MRSPAGFTAHSQDPARQIPRCLSRTLPLLPRSSASFGDEPTFPAVETSILDSRLSHSSGNSRATICALKRFAEGARRLKKPCESAQLANALYKSALRNDARGTSARRKAKSKFSKGRHSGKSPRFCIARTRFSKNRASTGTYYDTDARKT